MQSLNITLSDAIATALKTYLQSQESSLSPEAIVETALEKFLSEQGYPASHEPEETLDSAVESFRQGWQDTMTGKTIPVAQLWDGIDAE
jgi:hypothetical protein